ncbi:MAG: hypothetical protein JWQ81_6536 [Amycolatopsis sp.]|nr:hypothetical protein [Amycolatopsis sp.]
MLSFGYANGTTTTRPVDVTVIGLPGQPRLAQRDPHLTRNALLTGLVSRAFRSVERVTGIEPA